MDDAQVIDALRDWIEACREAKGMSKRELALTVGMSYGHIRDWLSGQKNGDLGFAKTYRIAQVFGTDMLAPLRRTGPESNALAEWKNQPLVRQAIEDQYIPPEVIHCLECLDVLHVFRDSDDVEEWFLRIMRERERR